MIKRKKKLRKNPILHVVDGIKYEIKDRPMYDVFRLISNFSEIIDKKFPSVKNKIPLIIFENINTGEEGLYYYIRNEISMSSDLNHDHLRMLFHELGHFVYTKYLNKNNSAYFNNYVNSQIKELNLLKLKQLLIKYGLKDMSIKFPLLYVLITSLRFSIWFNYFIEKTEYDGPINDQMFIELIDFIISLKKDFKETFFIKPASNYMPDNEEIFCEIFANYMMYDKRLLHSDNYIMLKQILPELR